MKSKGNLIPKKRMEGKRVLLTGGTSGIGSSTVALMADEGAWVAFTGRNTENGLKVQNDSGPKTKFIETDSRNHDSIINSINIAVEFMGGIDVLVNNVGIHAGRKNIEEMSEEDFDELQNVNLKSHIYYMKGTLPYMRQQKSGSIVNVNSINAIRGVYRRPDYTMTKGAMLSLTRQMALDYAAYNIRVNAIAFGLIMTPFALTDTMGISEGEMKSRVERIPLKRAGTPEEAAQVILFLSSDESSFVTGALIVADGGVTSASYI